MPTPMPLDPADLRDQAQSYGIPALRKLAALMRSGVASAAVQLGAARTVLDRGYGRPAVQRADDDESAPFTVVIRRFTEASEPEAECDNQRS